MAFELHLTIEGLVLCARPGSLPEPALRDTLSLILRDRRDPKLPLEAQHRARLAFYPEHVVDGIDSIDPAEFPYQLEVAPDGRVIVAHDFPAGSSYALTLSPTEPSPPKISERDLKPAIGLSGMDPKLHTLLAEDKRRTLAAGEVRFVSGTFSAVDPGPKASRWQLASLDANGQEQPHGNPRSYAQRLKLENRLTRPIAVLGDGKPLFALQGGVVNHLGAKGDVGAVKLAVSNVPLKPQATPKITHLQSLYDLTTAKVEQARRRYLKFVGKPLNAPLRENCPPPVEPPP